MREKLARTLKQLHDKLAEAAANQDIQRMRNIYETIKLIRETLHELEQIQPSKRGK